MCHGLHHTLICDKDVQQVHKYGDQPSHKPGVEHQNECQTSTNLCVEESRKYVLLQTAKLVIATAEYEATVRMVFDSCIKRSYISNSLKARTKLAVIVRETLLENTFGENEANLRGSCEIVKVGIKTRVVK